MTEAERDQATSEHFDNPQPGDRFTEMYAFWIRVEAVLPAGWVVVSELNPPGSFEDNGKPRLFNNAEEFREAYRYRSPSLRDKYWVSYVPTRQPNAD